MIFNSELEFEVALANLLTTKGWETEILQYSTEADLIKNWAQILFHNNRGIDRLNNCPLTDGEMSQILEQIRTLRTPLKLNGFINGKTVSITRDNPDDTLHLGREISLKIYDRREIAAGQSRYQIVRQPKFQSKSKILNDRRGDILLLINGMPVIHIELKKSGIPMSQATTQIQKYTREQVFTGLFSLVQIFVAMTPEETVYFANPGTDGIFNSDYFFHWADFDNEPINDYKAIASSVLSIPMAHQLIGFYTVADGSDGVLKVMRSYQYYAANAISDKVSKHHWDEKDQHGGYIWHTTGSGKTMTSFKSAQLIANSKDADKVIFLTDRIELGTQSLKEYRGFAEESDSVQATENTHILISKLKSKDPADALIVTSIQKMSNIKAEAENAHDIDLIVQNRIVFIVDEAHRSTFGEMLCIIKNTFHNALFFGFTGTPIHDENGKAATTADVFGNELHRYSIADGIRDKNVLAFDPYKILTFRDKDVRRAVALEMSKSKTEEEALSDPKKAAVYLRYMNASQTPMAGYRDKDGKYHQGIEDHLTTSQYQTETHRLQVVEDINENWLMLSRNHKFHGIFATSSIDEAITYYRLLKQSAPSIKATCLVDPHIDNTGGFEFKTDGLIEIFEDYNARYGQDFTLATADKFKKDVALRLAHKEHYKSLHKAPEKQLDLLIVVDQMLTGFDSKWINTLYLDKKLEYANIIQAFSRTNRLFGLDKPFGTIRYYRFPHTMTENIEKAVKSYSGDKPVALFVAKLQHNLEMMNEVYTEIVALFSNAGLTDFAQLPENPAEKAQFAKLFRQLNVHLEAAKIQGFSWSQTTYSFGKTIVELALDEKDYFTLALRYKELYAEGPGPNEIIDIPYDLVGHLTEINTGAIDADYMNSRFEKYMKLANQDSVSQELLEAALAELHKTFATLSAEDQKYAELFLRDVQRGDVIPEGGKTLRDYITEYGHRIKDDQIHRFAQAMGVDEAKLRYMMGLGLIESTLNEFGRLDDLKAGLDKDQANVFMETREGHPLIPPMLNIKIDKLLRDFILSGGFEI